MWLAALAVVPLLLRSLGAPLGEPVAEDFDFLHRALLEPSRSLLDGGGSTAFWRPLAHQLYYLALGPVMLARPIVVAGIHALAFALGAVLLYRALRPAWSGPAACAAAAFPLLAESNRTILAWPTQFVDLGLFLFSALALHEASRRRLPTALLALLAALFCKELAVITALLLPFVPTAEPRPKGERLRWAIGCAALVLAWGLAYLGVRQVARLELPHQLEHDPALLATPLYQRLLWSLSQSVRALLSLSAVPHPRDGVALNLLYLGVIATLGLLTRRSVRMRFRHALPWTAFGLAWFALATSALASIFPLWQPNRVQFGSVGLGIAATATLGSIHPALAAVPVAGRLAMLLLAPSASLRVASRAPETGAFMDFERLTRLQHLMRDMRMSLRAEFPTLPQGARVVWQFFPRHAQYALSGDRSLQCWYRDGTLHWVPISEFVLRREMPVATFVAYQQHTRPQMALIAPDAMRAYLDGIDLARLGAQGYALRQFARADSLQRPRQAPLFDGAVASARAMVLLGLGQPAEAEREARRALTQWRESMSAHQIVAQVAFDRGDLDEAGRHVDSVLRYLPGDSIGLALRAQIDAARRAGAR